MEKSYLITETKWGLPTIDLTLNNERDMKAIIDTGFDGIVIEPNLPPNIAPIATVELNFLDGTQISGWPGSAESLCITSTSQCAYQVDYVQSTTKLKNLQGAKILLGTDGIKSLAILGPTSTQQFMMGHSLLTYYYDSHSPYWGDDIIVPEFIVYTEKYWLWIDTIKLLNAEGEIIYEEDLAKETPSLVDSATTTISLPPRLYVYLTLTTRCGDGQDLSL